MFKCKLYLKLIVLGILCIVICNSTFAQDQPAKKKIVTKKTFSEEIIIQYNQILMNRLDALTKGDKKVMFTFGGMPTLNTMLGVDSQEQKVKYSFSMNGAQMTSFMPWSKFSEKEKLILSYKFGKPKTKSDHALLAFLLIRNNKAPLAQKHIKAAGEEGLDLIRMLKIHQPD